MSRVYARKILAHTRKLFILSHVSLHHNDIIVKYLLHSLILIFFCFFPRRVVIVFWYLFVEPIFYVFPQKYFSTDNFCFDMTMNAHVNNQNFWFCYVFFSQWLRCYCTGCFKWNFVLHSNNSYKYIIKIFSNADSIVIAQSEQTEINVQKTFSIFMPNLMNNSRISFHRNSFSTFLLTVFFVYYFSCNFSPAY